MIAGRHRPHSMETASHATPAATANLDAARMALLELGVNPVTLAAAIEAAELVAALTQDFDLTVATALHWARLHGCPGEPAPDNERLTAAALQLATALGRLGELSLPTDWS